MNEFEFEQAELDWDTADEWFGRATHGMVITYWLDTLAENLDALHRLRKLFPKDTTLLDFDREESGVQVTNISDGFALGIAQEVCEKIVMEDWSPQKAQELLEELIIEHARRYL